MVGSPAIDVSIFVLDETLCVGRAQIIRNDAGNVIAGGYDTRLQEHAQIRKVRGAAAGGVEHAMVYPFIGESARWGMVILPGRHRDEIAVLRRRRLSNQHIGRYRYGRGCRRA